MITMWVCGNIFVVFWQKMPVSTWLKHESSTQDKNITPCFHGVLIGTTMGDAYILHRRLRCLVFKTATAVERAKAIWTLWILFFKTAATLPPIWSNFLRVWRLIFALATATTISETTVFFSQRTAGNFRPPTTSIRPSHTTTP